MKFRKTATAILAATTAISAVSTLSVDVFAEGTPFTFTVEGAKSADGFEKEAKILTNFIGEENGEFGGILTNDTFITVNNGTEEIASKTYGIFEFFNFSEDGTSLEKKESYEQYFFRAIYNNCWDIDGVNEYLPFLPENEPITPDGEIDGIGVFSISEGKMVIGNKISGGLVRKVHEGHNNCITAMGDLVAAEGNPENYEATETTSYDEFDAVSLKIFHETEDGKGVGYSISFLTESYMNRQSKPTEPSASEPTTSEPITSEPEKKNTDYSDDTTGIKAAANEGVIADGAKLSVAAVADKTNDKNFTYEISFKKDDKNVQPNGKVTVKIPVPEALKGKTVYVYRVDGGKYYDMGAKVENGFIVFETDHFSEYLVTTEKNENAVKPATPGKNPATGIAGGVFGIMAIAGAFVIVSKKKR